MRTRTPGEVSADVFNAIQNALTEEKKPVSMRCMKIVFGSFLLAILSIGPVFFLFSDQIDAGLWVAAGFWWLCLVLGLALYYYPQPRLVVPGLWSPWILAKIVVLTSVLTCFELLICPSFVFIHTPLSWNIFEPLTTWFMATGGMRLCMFGCGFLFSSLTAFASFMMVSKTLKGSSWKGLFGVAALCLFAHLPIAFIQLWDEGLRPFVFYWILGSIIGILSIAMSIRQCKH